MFYYNNKDTKKLKDFQKLSNKRIYFILQTNSTKYKPFKFISIHLSLTNHPSLTRQYIALFQKWECSKNGLRTRSFQEY